ncbi:unnamed protein product [Boreogadus saida]
METLGFPPGSKQRKTLLESLRNKGDWQHNRLNSGDMGGHVEKGIGKRRKAKKEEYKKLPHNFFQSWNQQEELECARHNEGIARSRVLAAGDIGSVLWPHSASLSRRGLMAGCSGRIVLSAPVLCYDRACQ